MKRLVSVFTCCNLWKEEGQDKMEQTVSIGNQDFRSLRENKSFYIDKSLFIKEWWESQDIVTLITRPRRFGKTLNLNMLMYFFSNHYADRGDLFEGLSIWTEETYRDLQGQYPVIFLSFADIKGQNYQDTREGIISAVAELYKNHDYLLQGDVLSDAEKEYFISFENYMVDTSTGRPLKDASITRALKQLSFYLSRYYGKKVLIFLDEYDTPLQEAYVNGYWNEITGFIRSIFNSTFKTNPYMERGLLTGITRVSKESIFSDLNNLEIVTTTSEKYCTRFGFTEEEVFAALELFGMPDEKMNVKQWYDGFTFGSQKDIYNPWSITCFLENREFIPYWANSSSNMLISSLIRKGSPQTKMFMEDLLKERSLTMEIDEEIVFNQLQKKRGAIWSLLLASGYLRVDERVFDQKAGRFDYRLVLTNREVRMMFDDMVRDWFADEDIPYNNFLKALLLDDVDYMNQYMNEVAELTFSSFDTGKKTSDTANPERFYHGFVLGLIVELAGEYKVSSNRESGFGRYDVMLEPLDRSKRAYVLEFKVRNPKKDRTLEDSLQAALTQIEEKDYDRELLARGIPRENIRHYGFAFEGKKVLIGAGGYQ